MPHQPPARSKVLRAVRDAFVLRHFVSIAVFAPVFDGTSQHYRISLLHYHGDNVIPVPWLTAGMQLHFGVNAETVVDELMRDLMPTVDLVRGEINALELIVREHAHEVIYPFLIGVDHSRFEIMRDYDEYVPLYPVTTCMHEPKPKQVEPYIRQLLMN